MTNRTRLSKPDVYYISLVCVFLGIALTLFNHVTVPANYPFGNDAVNYIQRAVSFSKGDGHLSIPFGVSNPEITLEFSKFHPLGFSVLIAALSSLGFNESSAAFLISSVSLAILPAVLMFPLLYFFSIKESSQIILLIITAPSFYLVGPTVNADIPGTVFAILSIGFMVWSGGKRRWLMVSGLLMACSYAIRNPTLAYYAALIATFFLAYILRFIDKKYFFKAIFYFILGSAPVLLTLIIRNMILFSDVQPYEMFRGHYSSIVDSFRVFLDSFFWELTGKKEIARQIAWDFKFFIVISCMVMMMVGYVLVNKWGLIRENWLIVLFAPALLSITAVMLVIAHTYHGLDYGNLIRHMIPVTWVIFVILFVLIKYSTGSSNIFLSVFSVLFFLHVWTMYSSAITNKSYMKIFSQSKTIHEAAEKIPADAVLTNFIKFRLEQDRELIEAVNLIPDGALIVSNMGMFLSHMTGKIIRDIEFNGYQTMNTLYNKFQSEEGVIRQNDIKVFVIIVVDNSILKNLKFEEWNKLFGRNLEAKFELIHKKDNFVVYKPLLG